jgi:ABC-type transporter Mla MlaB component
VFVVEDGRMFAGGPAMLKIVRVDGDTSPSHSIPTLKLEGKLVGPWVDELSRACDELQTSPSGLCLNVSAVTFIDPAGIKLLGDLIRRGTTIRECTGFIEELLGRNPA